jgi:hypothetical protein
MKVCKHNALSLCYTTTTTTTPSFGRGRGSRTKHYGEHIYVAFRAGDVLAIGRALIAWPLPLLHDVEVDDDEAPRSSGGLAVGRLQANVGGGRR